MPVMYKNSHTEVNLEELASEELFDFIDNIPSESEDELDEDSEDEQFKPEANNSVPAEELNEYFDTKYPSEEISQAEIIEEEPGTSSNPIQKKSTSVSWKCKELLWRKKNLGDVPSTFTGNVDLSEAIKNLETPYDYFKYFFDDALMEHIVEETRKYSASKDPTKVLQFTMTDLNRYLGICIISSVASITNTRMYWNETIGLRIVQDALSVRAFERIRSFLHFNDNSIDAQGDKLHKLRPVIDSLSKKFLSVPMEEMLSIDEQICATKARHHMKQYLPLKPHKWGYKLFVLSGVSGFCYKFEIYTGRENDPEKRLSDEPDLGASSNVVVRLAREIPRNCYYKVYFDNYYTSVPVITYLAKLGIHSLGTVRRNRLPSCKVPSEAEGRKLERGTCGEFVANYDGIDISNVYWKDNKMVTLLSSFVGIDPIDKVDRYDRKGHEKIQVSCPAIVRQYNRHMGGVDLLDSIIGKYKIKMRSRKWYMRLFYHLLDITIINAWLLYRRCNQENNKLLKLADFRIELARTLCSIGGTSSTPKRGRPSVLQQTIECKRKKPNAAALPPQEVRLDNVCHFPIWNTTRLRCKNPTCKAQTYVLCEKCKTALCFNKDKICFKTFHEK